MSASPSVHDRIAVVTSGVPDTPGELLGLSFPRPDAVRAAAGAFRDLSVLTTWGGEEGRRFHVEVGPGVVSLRVTDRARREYRRDNPASSTATVRPWRNRAGQVVWSPDLSSSLHDLDGYAPYLNVNDPGRCERLSWRSIVEWSPKSRRRLVLRVAEYDFRAMLGAGLPAMVTLTYPGEWEALAPNGDTAKKHLQALKKRWLRRWSGPCSGAEHVTARRPIPRPREHCVTCDPCPIVGLWKLEFQRRGAPHFHLFVVPPGDGASFRSWLSDAWADICGASGGELERHKLAGTAVDYSEAARCRDPRRLAVYFLKHGTKTHDDKEYQHVVPLAWRGRGDGPGRFWGAWGLDREVSAVRLHPEDFVAAKRTLRRWSRAQGRTRQVSVWRHDGGAAVGWEIDPVTGVTIGRRPRRRKVTRRTYQLGHSRLVGGWLVVNSGPALAIDLARALRLRT